MEESPTRFEDDVSRKETSATPWEEKSRWGKRREVLELTNIPSKKLLLATTMSSRKEGQKELTTLLKHAAISPARPAKILKAYKSSTVGRPYTPEEALAQLIDEGLSKSTYENIRKQNISLGHRINPPYGKVLEAKQRCRPPREALKVTEVSAELSLQSLLEHTAVRLAEVQEEVILHHQEMNNITR